MEMFFDRDEISMWNNTLGSVQKWISFKFTYLVKVLEVVQDYKQFTSFWYSQNRHPWYY